MDKLIGLKRIKENTESEIEIVCATLVKILKPIVESPNDSSKRSVKLDTLENLMSLNGGMETLFEIGFIEDDDSLILPNDAKIEDLKEILNELNKLTQKQEETAQAPACQTTLTPKPPTLPLKNLNLNSRINNNKFALRLQNTYDHVLIYEDVNLKQKAFNLVPVQRLTQEARVKFNAYIEQIKKSATRETKPYDLKDFFLLELMAWFKNEFFSWVNSPNCNLCSTNEHMQFKQQSGPEPSEALWLASNVEVYECSMCRQKTRFPRYNHPEKLLETRKGRCGEWANAFCLLLRSTGFDSRYILDWTDHVWCEVFSESQKRWLHADPCENTLDKPLIYEHGWNKKLSYIIGFSSYECIDVTWRYTTRTEEVLTRRNECDEQWLVGYTSKLSQNRQIHFDKSKKEKIQLRLVAEIVEFLTPKQVKDGEDVGRQSGSLQWRLNRGEIEIPAVANGFVFEPNSETNLFQVRYNSTRDVYDYSRQLTNGWKNCAYKYTNIQHKTENDWKMVYLARTNGSSEAYIEWMFDLSKISKKLNQISMKLESKCFETGSIKWSFHWSETRQEIDNNKLNLNDSSLLASVPFKLEKQTDNDYIVNSFSSSRFGVFKIRADLSLGNGSNAWQHTQLFRQSLNDADKYSFDVCFHFSD